MKSKLKFALFDIFLVLLVVSIVVIAAWKTQKGVDDKQSEIEDLEKRLADSAELLAKCGTSLKEREQICSETGAEAMKRANLIFECEQRICEVNGWSPPLDWEEVKEEMNE